MGPVRPLEPETRPSPIPSYLRPYPAGARSSPSKDRGIDGKYRGYCEEVLQCLGPWATRRYHRTFERGLCSHTEPPDGAGRQHSSYRIVLRRRILSNTDSGTRRIGFCVEPGVKIRCTPGSAVKSRYAVALFKCSFSAHS